MARPQRIECEGAAYHVTARGNERRAIFHDDADREGFLRVLGIRNGASVSRQLTRRARKLESNRSLRNRIREIVDSLFGIVLCISILVGASVFGCRPSGHVGGRQIRQTGPLADVKILMDGLSTYLETMGTLPASIEAFRSFCLKSDLPCNMIDWSRVSWESTGDGKLVVSYECEGYSMPITLERGSDPTSDDDPIPKRGKESLRELMEAH